MGTVILSGSLDEVLSLGLGEEPDGLSERFPLVDPLLILLEGLGALLLSDADVVRHFSEVLLLRVLSEALIYAQQHIFQKYSLNKIREKLKIYT